MEEKTKNIKAFGIVDISVNEFRKIALVHLVDDLILKFDRNEFLKGVSKQHKRALKDDLFKIRAGAAERAGIKKGVVRWRKKVSK